MMALMRVMLVMLVLLVGLATSHAYKRDWDERRPGADLAAQIPDVRESRTSCSLGAGTTSDDAEALARLIRSRGGYAHWQLDHLVSAMWTHTCRRRRDDLKPRPMLERNPAALDALLAYDVRYVWCDFARVRNGRSLAYRDGRWRHTEW